MDVIHGVRVIPCKVVPDERGTIKRIINTDQLMLPIRDVYYTSVYKDVVKGWHGYKTKTICFSCVQGCVKLVMYDGRINQGSYQNYGHVIMGTDNPCTVIVPPGVFSAFKGISSFAEIVVAADEVFSEDGMIRRSIDTFEYDWRTKNG